ncbi:hypothetical protein [Neolewinella persica]|uniref:hypothetical protein n=1 Tax=Neolewinella persica TaxID=70998 RepID=UPI000374B285|nr:hypothetical protein [Neolewinella persica]
MTHTTAKTLLDRYFLGETTLEEEEQLRAYFRAGDIHPDLAPYPPLFSYWEQAGEIVAPKVRRPAIQRRLPVRWLAAVAAAVVMLLCLHTWFNQQPDLSSFPIAEAQPIDWSKYEVTDPEEAYRLLRGALKTASSEINRGPEITIRELGEVRRMLK